MRSLNLHVNWVSCVLFGLGSAGLVACSSGQEEGAAAVADDVAADPDCVNGNTPGATATCLSPTQTPEHYVLQAERYFDTLDVSVVDLQPPVYSEEVARWEWPPWLLLTGLWRTDMLDTAEALRDLDPSTVPERDCRAFEVQPFARCYVVFEYEEGLCPIYEEFTFNDAGEVTFIEAWSDLPDLRPHTGEDDPWGEQETLNRLSTRVPGLGNPDGRFDLQSAWMLEAAGQDPDVADFAARAADWWTFWYETLADSPTDFFARGCGW